MKKCISKILGFVLTVATVFCSLVAVTSATDVDFDDSFDDVAASEADSADVEREYPIDVIEANRELREKRARVEARYKEILDKHDGLPEEPESDDSVINVKTVWVLSALDYLTYEQLVMLSEEEVIDFCDKLTEGVYTIVEFRYNKQNERLVYQDGHFLNNKFYLDGKLYDYSEWPGDYKYGVFGGAFEAE